MPDTTEPMVTYIWSPRVGGVAWGGDTKRVTVPLASVMLKEGRDSDMLSAEAGEPFVEAVRNSDVPFVKMIEEVKRLQMEHPHTVRRANAPGADPEKFPVWAVQPHPYAHVESWEPEPQPWPVFVIVLDGCVAEFYPEHFTG